MIDSPCHGCGGHAVGCHAACESYKAYADGRKQALENRYTACIEGTGRKRSHERWLKFQRKAQKGG